jgi:hypothetical protein
MKKYLIAAAIFCVAFLCLPGRAVAGELITDPSGAFAVGIGPNGELFDYTSYVGFQRVADGYDPLKPGDPRDSWGVSANGSSAWADQAGDGSSGVSSIVSMGANGGTITTTASGLGLQVTQTYSFAPAGNILLIGTTVTNISGSVADSVLFQRDVDWDVSPTEYNENSFGNPVTGNVVDSSYHGFEYPDPLVAYGTSCAAGCNYTGDLGGGIELSLGNLAPGASASFTYLYGINSSQAIIDGGVQYGGQTVDQLISEAQGLGAYYWIATQSSENGAHPNLGENSAIIGVIPSTSIPEPASFVAMAMGLAVLAARSRRRKNQ